MSAGIPQAGTINDRSSKPHRVEPLVELVAKNNNQLALDMDAVNQTQISSTSTQPTPDAALDLVASETIQKPSSVLGTMSQGVTATELARNSSILSPEERTRILSKLSPALQTRIKGGLLTDRLQFPRCSSSEKPWPELRESLASLIEDRLKWPKKRSESQQLHDTRRRSLLANAEWLRQDSFTGSLLPHSRRKEGKIKEKLRTLVGWRDFHIVRLGYRQASRSNTSSARRRSERLRVLIEETTKSIQHLEAAIETGSSEHDDRSPPVEPDDEHSKQSSHQVEAHVSLKPTSLSDSLLFQLSRDLLDSLNEAAFDFGQREAPTMMEKNCWTFPETIDLPVFVSSLNLNSDLSHRFVNSARFFSRLREFRNRYAHGAGEMSAGHVSSTLRAFAAVARLLRSSELTVKVEQYTALTEKFTVDQTEFTEKAYPLIQKFKADLREKLKRVQAEARSDGGAPQDASAHLTAYQTTMMKEAWKLAQRSMREHNERRISFFVGESQIRRIVKKMGPSETAVLSKLQEEKTSLPIRVDTDQGTKKILGLLGQKLSEALEKGTNEQARETDSAVKRSGSIADNINADDIKAKLLELLPPARTARGDRKTWQQQELSRQLNGMRKGL